MKLKIGSEIQEIGALGEEVACEFLRSKGYMIIDRNYDVAEGELDIICTRLRTVYFCEVKTSIYPDKDAIDASVTYETVRPEDRIDYKKRMLLKNTALQWKFAQQFHGKHHFMDIGVFLLENEQYAVVDMHILE